MIRTVRWLVLVPYAVLSALCLVASASALVTPIAGESTASTRQRVAGPSAPLTRDQIVAVVDRAARGLHAHAVRGGYVNSLPRRGDGGRTSPAATGSRVETLSTAAVGDALLAAYAATGEPDELKFAQETGTALALGQLADGGWEHDFETDPRSRALLPYRIAGDTAAGRRPGLLDNDITQSPARFLMRLDRALDHRAAPVHEAALAALEFLLRAQFENGAWPQQFTGWEGREPGPLRRARYPASWRRIRDVSSRHGYYRAFYTLNDGVSTRTIETLLLGAEVYDEAAFGAAAGRGGEFLLLAQMPSPQPAWAQQYDFDMEPAWARSLEPPAIASRESLDAVDVLLDLYEDTGDLRFLGAARTAVEYLEQVPRVGGRLARLYELRTDRPIFVDDAASLTYDPSRARTTYGYLIDDTVAARRARIDTLERARDSGPRAAHDPSVPASARVGAAQQAVSTVGVDGLWPRTGPIDVGITVSHLRALIRVLASPQLEGRG